MIRRGSCSGELVAMDSFHVSSSADPPSPSRDAWGAFGSVSELDVEFDWVRDGRPGGSGNAAIPAGLPFEEARLVPSEGSRVDRYVERRRCQ